MACSPKHRRLGLRPLTLDHHCLIQPRLSQRALQGLDRLQVHPFRLAELCIRLPILLKERDCHRMYTLFNLQPRRLHIRRFLQLRPSPVEVKDHQEAIQEGPASQEEALEAMEGVAMLQEEATKGRQVVHRSHHQGQDEHLCRQVVHRSHHQDQGEHLHRVHPTLDPPKGTPCGTFTRTSPHGNHATG